MSKFKTVFCVRNGQIDSCMTVEWPEHLTSDALRTLAKIRGDKPDALLKELAPEAAELCSVYFPMQIRSRYNMMDGPYIVDSDTKPTDQELLAFWKRQRKPE